jgi:DNA-binding NtrC family response regulator
MNPLKRIAVVDDDPSILNNTVRVLRGAGHEVCAYDNAETAMEAIQQFQPEIVITDVNLPGRDGISLASGLREKLPDCRIVLYSGTLLPLVVTFARHGGYELLQKPLEEEQLLALIARPSPLLSK